MSPQHGPLSLTLRSRVCLLQHWFPISHGTRALDDSQKPSYFHAHNSWYVCKVIQVSANEWEESTATLFCRTSVGYHLELCIAIIFD